MPMPTSCLIHLQRHTGAENALYCLKRKACPLILLTSSLGEKNIPWRWDKYPLWRWLPSDWSVGRLQPGDAGYKGYWGDQYPLYPSDTLNAIQWGHLQIFVCCTCLASTKQGQHESVSCSKTAFRELSAH